MDEVAIDRQRDRQAGRCAHAKYKYRMLCDQYNMIYACSKQCSPTFYRKRGYVGVSTLKVGNVYSRHGCIGVHIEFPIACTYLTFMHTIGETYAPGRLGGRGIIHSGSMH